MKSIPYDYMDELISAGAGVRSWELFYSVSSFLASVVIISPLTMSQRAISA